MIAADIHQISTNRLVVSRIHSRLLRQPKQAITNIIYKYINGLSFWRGFGQEVCPSRSKYAIRGKSVERRHRGTAPTPHALTNPSRMWPGSGTLAKREKLEVGKIYVF